MARAMATTEGAASGPVRRLGAALLVLGRIRLELFAIELQEEKERIAAQVLWSVLTALLAGFGAAFLVMFATVALWDTHRLEALGGATVLLLGGAGLGLLRLRRLGTDGAAPFGASVDELRKDAAVLAEGPPR